MAAMRRNAVSAQGGGMARLASGPALRACKEYWPDMQTQAVLVSEETQAT